MKYCETITNIYPYNIAKKIAEKKYDTTESQYDFVHRVYIPVFLDCIESIATDRNKLLALDYFSTNKTLAECGARYNMTRANASLIVNKFIDQLASMSDRYMMTLDKFRQFNDTMSTIVRQQLEMTLLANKLDNNIQLIATESGAVTGAKLSASTHADIINTAPLASLSMSQRTYNALSRSGYTTIGQILNITPNILMNKTRGLGKTGVNELRIALKTKYDISF